MARIKVIRRRRLTGVGTVLQDRRVPPLRVSDAPLSGKKEALYRAIGDALAFLHGREPQTEAMAAVRRFYPAPQYFAEANPQALRRLGLSRLDAFYFSMLPALTRTCLSQQWGMRPELGGMTRMADYLKTLYIGVHIECFYLVLLDRQCRLIRPVLLQKGGVDNAPFYLGQLLAAALADNARYIVLAHNHPGGTKSPSKEDLQCTLQALNALAPLRIPLLDHMIVAGDEVVSIRAMGVLRDLVWHAALPGSRIVDEWMNVED